MDKKLKIVIVVLIGFAVLFAGGVLSNLVPKQRDGKNSKDYLKGDQGWEKTLGEWMAPLAPSLEIKILLQDNKDSCSSGSHDSEQKEIMLNEDKDTCVIEIPALKGEDYGKGKLSLAKEETRNVTVLFLPKGDSDEDDPEPAPLAFDQAVSFVVLEKGGTLSVECKNCFDDRKEAVTVLIE